MAGQQVWDFTPDEFAWVWGETGYETYPDPVSIFETPATKEEHRRLIRKLKARYPRNGDPELTAGLQVLAHPELRIICAGRVHDSPVRIRVLGAAVGEVGVVLVQKPGAMADFGGDLELVVTQRERLGAHIAATMPDASVGTAGEMVGETPRVRAAERPANPLPSAGKAPVEDHIREILQAPRAAEGHLRVERWPPGEPPHPPEYLTWIDVSPEHPAAGRYLVEIDDNESIVTPASPDVVARELKRRAER